MFLSANKRQGKFSIDLSDHRFYYPGEVVRGHVTLGLVKPTRTLNIRLVLTAEIQCQGQTVQLFSDTQTLAVSPEGEGKPHVLPAQTHSFAFEVRIPDDQGPLPSTMKIAKVASVRYTLMALHNKPLVPASLTPQAIRFIPVLERIDINDSQYCRNSVETINLPGPDGKRLEHPIASMSVSIPKSAIVRGDIAPVNITLNHPQTADKCEVVHVQLVRNLYSRKNAQNGSSGDTKERLLEQAVVSSNSIDVDPHRDEKEEKDMDIHTTKTIILSTKILVPTSTPPTVEEESGRILKIDYGIRVAPSARRSKTKVDSEVLPIQKSLTLPVVIGTFPKSDLSIDDDDGDDDEEEDTVHKDLTFQADSGDSPRPTQSHSLEDKMGSLNISAASLTHRSASHRDTSASQVQRLLSEQTPPTRNSSLQGRDGSENGTKPTHQKSELAVRGSSQESLQRSSSLAYHSSTAEAPSDGVQRSTSQTSQSNTAEVLVEGVQRSSSNGCHLNPSEPHPDNLQRSPSRPHPPLQVPNMGYPSPMPPHMADRGNPNGPWSQWPSHGYAHQPNMPPYQHPPNGYVDGMGYASYGAPYAPMGTVASSDSNVPALVRNNTTSSTYSHDSTGSSTSYNREQDVPPLPTQSPYMNGSPHAYYRPNYGSPMMEPYADYGNGAPRMAGAQPPPRYYPHKVPYAPSHNGMPYGYHQQPYYMGPPGGMPHHTLRRAPPPMQQQQQQHHHHQQYPSPARPMRPSPTNYYSTPTSSSHASAS